MDPFLPTSSRETPRRNLGRYAGGFFAGAVLGAGAMLWFVAVIEPYHRGHYEALTPLLLGVFGTPVAALIGGVFGLVWARRLGHADDPRRVLRRSALIAVAATAVLLAALPFLRDRSLWRSGNARHERVQRVLELDVVGERDVWGSYDWRYPREPASLEPLFGPLLYPGSTLVEWVEAEQVPGLPPPPGWEITVSAPDGADKVLAYYMTVLPEGIDGYGIGNAPGPTGEWATVSADQESADGRVTVVRIEGEDDDVTIRFRTTSGTTERSMAGHQPWPEPDAYRNQVAAARKPYLDALHTEFGDWLYPDAELVFGDLQNLKSIAFDTPDPMEKVVDFYAAHNTEPEWIGEKYRFWHRGNSVRRPEFYVYPIHGGTRIYFRLMR